jgi:hypothetical protein
MSQSTNFSEFNEELDERLFQQYYDEIFREFPLPIVTHQIEEATITDVEIVRLKLRWIIEYFVAHTTYKTRIKEMLGPLLDLAANTSNREKLLKNVGNLRIMVKHCDIEEIHPLLVETVFQSVWQGE